MYNFTVLLFGLASEPRVFTKFMKPVFAAFRANYIKCGYFIDDSLVINRNYSDCKNETQLIVSELDKLGFTNNLKKSILEPTHRIIFF